MSTVIAQTIWQQITPQTKMACAARLPVSDTNKLIFRVTIIPRVTHKIEVVLDLDDTYTVKLHYITQTKCKVEEEKSGIYSGNLNEVIYKMCNK